MVMWPCFTSSLVSCCYFELHVSSFCWFCIDSPKVLQFVGGLNIIILVLTPTPNPKQPSTPSHPQFHHHTLYPNDPLPFELSDLWTTKPSNYRAATFFATHRCRLLEITVGRDFSSPFPSPPFRSSFLCALPSAVHPFRSFPLPLLLSLLSPLKSNYEVCESAVTSPSAFRPPNPFGAFSGWNLHNLCYRHNDIFAFCCKFYCFKNDNEIPVGATYA